MTQKISPFQLVRRRYLRSKPCFPYIPIIHLQQLNNFKSPALRLTNEDRRKKLDPSHDPLHNPGSSNGTNSRAVYLDAERRRALREDYGVEPFTVHQFVGEALFIPAGSPRQVCDNHASTGWEKVDLVNLLLL